MREELKNGFYLGIVEENVDPEKKQRVRIRIPYIHGNNEEIPTDYLPWARPIRNTDGKEFNVPDINKVVSVSFPNGNAYMPMYMESLHLDLNLQKKIESLSDDEYVKFRSICYDYNTQIYVNGGIYMIYGDNGFIIKDNKIINRLKDNNSKYLVGDENANQSMVLGDNFFNWFDDFLKKLIKSPYLGNSGFAVIADPELIYMVNNYFSLRSTFLSQNAYLSENRGIADYTEDTINNIGDNYDMTNKEKEINIEVIEKQEKEIEKQQIEKERSDELVKEENDIIKEEKLIKLEDNVEKYGKEDLNETAIIKVEDFVDYKESTYVYKPTILDTTFGEAGFRSDDEDINETIIQEDKSNNKPLTGLDMFGSDGFDDYDPAIMEWVTPPGHENAFMYGSDESYLYDNSQYSSGTAGHNVTYSDKKEKLDWSLSPYANNYVSSFLTYERVIRSATAKANGLDNNIINNDHLRNMIETTKRYYDPVYVFFKKLGYVLELHSAYRGSALNSAIGGAINSQHMTGSAMDLVLTKNGKRYNNLLFYYFKHKFNNFGQLIWEYDCAKELPSLDGDNGPRWIHISIDNGSKRNHVFGIGAKIKQMHPETRRILTEHGII